MRMQFTTRARVRAQWDAVRRLGWTNYLASRRDKIRYFASRLFQDTSRYRNSWEDLRGRFAGQRAFLIGNGPSLNKTPLYLLKGERKMCFNHFHLMLERVNWSIDFFATVDNLVLDDLVSSIPQIAKSTEYIFIPDIHPRGGRYVDRIPEVDNLYWMQPEPLGKGFSTALPRVYGGGSVIYEGLQILAFLGFKEIALIGVDMNYKIHKNVDYLKSRMTDIESKGDDDPNHFDPRYFGRGRRYHQPEQHVVDNIVGRLRYAAQVAPQLGIRIINVGFDSKVDSFERRDFHEYLGLDAAGIRERFNDCVVAHTAFASVEAMAASLPAISLEKAREFEGSFAVTADDGVAIVKEKVLTHLPLGPFRGAYYFVERLRQ